jgi:hypothetical protein
MGETSLGDLIMVEPKITRAVGNTSKIHVNATGTWPAGDLTPDELQERDEGMGFWVPSDPQYSLADTTVAHEEGHVLADRVSLDAPGALYSVKLLKPLSKAMGVPTPVSDVDDIQDWIKNNKPAISKSVSEYGATNYGELQAELWSEYTMNANPRPPAKVYGDYVTAQLKAQDDL